MSLFKRKSKILYFLIYISLVCFLNAEESTSLPQIQINEKEENLNGPTENTKSYTTGSTNTATKLDLRIKDTPQVVTVFTQEKLKDQNISSFQELLSKTTGVSVNKWDERVYPTARGFDVDYYLYDGMPTYDQSANDIDLIMFDRIEVVKGANGLMTGAGNPSMGMNFIRKHANSKKIEIDANLQAGSWNNYMYSLDVQGPLSKSGNTRGRFVAKQQNTKSFMNYYKKQSDTVYGVIDTSITDSSYLSFGAGYNNLKRSGIRWGGLPAFYTDYTQTNFDRSYIVSNDWTYWDVETKNVFLDFTQYVYDDISLNLSLSRRDFDTKTKLAYISGLVDKDTNLANGDLSRYTSSNNTNENNINLYSSIPFSTYNLDHELIIGAVYNKQNKTDSTWANANLENQTGVDIFHVKNPNSNWTTFGTNPNNYTEQKAIYIAGKISIIKDLKLISGARLSSWKYISDDKIGNKDFENEVTPYIGLVYDLNKNHSIYASYTNIFKPQSYKDINGNYLDPIKGNSYETGIKGEYYEGYLNTTLSIFQIKQDGVGELTTSMIPNTSDYAYKATSGVISKGVEIVISGKIFDFLDLDFGLANFQARDSKGNLYDTKSSRTTSNLFVKYHDNTYEAGLGINYKSKFYTITDYGTITQKEFFTTDLMMSYKLNKSIKFQINANNIFDVKYYDAIGSDAMVYGVPRNIIASMKYTY